MSRARSAALLTILPLYLALATAIGFVDFRIRDDHNQDKGFVEYSPSVVSGAEPPPGRYRVLAPYVWHGLTGITGLLPRESWVLFRWLCVLAALLAGHLYFRTWFDDVGAVAGNLLVAALLPLTFTNGWAHPDHLMELFLFTLGCACIARGWDVALVPVLVLNGLNRETSAFLVLLFLLARPMSRRHLAWTAVLAGTWVAVYAGLRTWRGWGTYDYWQFGRNLTFLMPLPANFDPYKRVYAWFVVVLVAPLVWLMAPSWPRLPRFMKAAAAGMTPAVLVTGFLFSSVIETRIFTPLIPALVPAVVFALTERMNTRILPNR